MWKKNFFRYMFLSTSSLSEQKDDKDFVFWNLQPLR